MSIESDHNNGKELQEGKEVQLGVRPHHFHDSSRVAPSEHHNHHIHKDHAQNFQAHENFKDNTGQPKYAGSPKVNLHPNPTSRVSPQRPPKKRKRIRESLRAIRSHRHWHNAKLVVGTVLVFLLIFNSQWFISQFIYFFNRTKPSEAPVPTQTVTQNPIIEQAESAELVGPNNEIIIPKIGVTAPLVFVNTTNEAEVLLALRSGVVHYYGTALPGENGNTAFFGHSSNDWWEPGNYKFVFVLLEKLTVGDTYEIHYNSRKYVYRVTQTKVVEPNDLSVLNQTERPTSTLITCTPPGTALKRFVVSAEQIAPKPVNNKIASNTPVAVKAQPKLPSAPPSLWQQLKDFFAGLFGNKKEVEKTETTVVPPNRLPEIKN